MTMYNQYFGSIGFLYMDGNYDQDEIPLVIMFLKKGN